MNHVHSYLNRASFRSLRYFSNNNIRRNNNREEEENTNRRRILQVVPHQSHSLTNERIDRLLMRHEIITSPQRQSSFWFQNNNRNNNNNKNCFLTFLNILFYPLLSSIDNYYNHNHTDDDNIGEGQTTGDKILFIGLLFQTIILLVMIFITFICYFYLYFYYNVLSVDQMEMFLTYVTIRLSFIAFLSVIVDNIFKRLSTIVK